MNRAAKLTIAAVAGLAPAAIILILYPPHSHPAPQEAIHDAPIEPSKPRVRFPVPVEVRVIHRVTLDPPPGAPDTAARPAAPAPRYHRHHHRNKSGERSR